MNKDSVEVLIADDDAELRSTLASVLRSCGYSFIHYASNGGDAVQFIEKGRPEIHLAFLDISMPVLNGIDATKKIQEIKPNCFCVIVSGYSDIENVKNALTAGAKGFVVKPFTTQKIIDVLTKFEQTVPG